MCTFIDKSQKSGRANTKYFLFSTQVTTPPPVENECGCMNGGTCVIRIIRGRRILQCACPEGYSGSRCENET